MGLSDPRARRHFAEGLDRRYDADVDVDVATENGMHRSLLDPCQKKHQTGPAVRLTRHLRTDPTPEEVRALERHVEERRKAGPPAMAAAPAAAAEV